MNCIIQILNLKNKLTIFYKIADDLYENEIISLEENDLLVEGLSNFRSFLFELISNCSFIEFKFDDKNDNKMNWE